jgi:hypothetical protein
MFRSIAEDDTWRTRGSMMGGVTMMKSLVIVVAAAVLTAVGVGSAAQRPGGSKPMVEVYKDPSCGCCTNWVKHLQDNGFATRVVETANLDDVKSRSRVPVSARSCHTAIVDGYVIEGHVPASDVKRLLRQRPGVLGLAVPGMPVGSPGMEVPGVKAAAYNVLSFDRAGQTAVYASH